MFKMTQAMFDYWNDLRGETACPKRIDLDPRAISAQLSETFLLTVDAAGQLPYRLAGSRVCSLFGHEMKDLSFLLPFSGEQRESLMRLVRSVVHEKAAALGFVRATLIDGRTVPVQILLLPLADAGGQVSRILGTMAIDSAAFIYEGNPVDTMSLYATRLLLIEGAAVAQSPSLAPEMLALAARSERKFGHLKLVVSR